MPLPPTPLTISGCSAIRYRITIPSLHDRPLHPLSDSTSSPVHLPFTCADHCNDCRRATGHILPHWLCTPLSMVSASLVLRSTSHLAADASERGEVDEPEERTAYLPAAEIFEPPGSMTRDSFLTFYQSSTGRRRSFCGRCGTMVAYSIFPMLQGWPDMLDIVLGTIDREDLELGDGEVLAPERQLWYSLGIPWVQRMSDGWIGHVPRHPIYKVNEVVS